MQWHNDDIKIRAMRFNAHSLLLCGLFAYICMGIMRF